MNRKALRSSRTVLIEALKSASPAAGIATPAAKPPSSSLGCLGEEPQSDNTAGAFQLTLSVALVVPQNQLALYPNIWYLTAFRPCG
jgi:hypothetical protein